MLTSAIAKFKKKEKTAKKISRKMRKKR